MNVCLIAGGFACVLLAYIPLQAQIPSSGEEAAAKAKNILRKSESPIPAAHKPVFVPTGLDLKASIGYAYTSLSTPTASRANLMGVDAAVIADLSLYLE